MNKNKNIDIDYVESYLTDKHITLNKDHNPRLGRVWIFSKTVGDYERCLKVLPDKRHMSQEDWITFIVNHFDSLIA